MRTCVGCRKRAAKADLLRVVVGAGSVVTDDDPIGWIVPDPGAIRPGRGAYLHPTSKCLELAERRRAFVRALRVNGPVELLDVRGYLERNASR